MRSVAQFKKVIEYKSCSIFLNNAAAMMRQFSYVLVFRSQKVAAVLQQGAYARPGSTSTKQPREMLFEGRLLELKTIWISNDVLVAFYNLSEFECNLLSVEDGRGMLRYAS